MSDDQPYTRPIVEAVCVQCGMVFRKREGLPTLGMEIDHMVVYNCNGPIRETVPTKILPAGVPIST